MWWIVALIRKILMSFCHNFPNMCGRYRLSRRKQIIEEHFDSDPWDEDWTPRYNIAPTQPVPVIRQHPKEPVRELSLMRWGLIPSWAKDPSVAAQHDQREVGNGGHEARVPRCAEIPQVPDPCGRLLRVGANGESQAAVLLRSQRMASCSRSRDCGIGWKDPSGNWVKTCSILTTTPNAVTSAVHDRMPVILDPDSYDLWLDPGMSDVAAVSELLKPYDARLMRCYPVSTRINHVANDDEECSRPVEVAEIQNRLFS